MYVFTLNILSLQNNTEISSHASLFTRYNHFYCHVTTVLQHKCPMCKERHPKCQEKHLKCLKKMSKMSKTMTEIKPRLKLIVR